MNKHLVFLLWLSSTLFFSVPARTETFIWDGSAGNWSDVSHWNLNLLPGPNDAVIINAGTVTLDIAPTVASLRLGGTLQGVNGLTISGNLTLIGNSYMGNTGNTSVGGALNWEDGTLGNASGTATGTVTVAGLTTFYLAGTWKNLRKKTLILNGGALMLGGISISEGAVMRNPAGKTFDVAVNGTSSFSNNFGGLSYFENYGLLHRTGPGGPISTAADISFLNYGTTTHTGGSSFIFETFTNQPGGIIAGTQPFIFSTIFNNNGAIAPGGAPGILHISRTGGIPVHDLNIEVKNDAGAGAGHDQLQTTGNFNIDGALQVTLLDGFVPANGTTYTILTYASRNGEFSTVNPSCWTVTYGPTNAWITYNGLPETCNGVDDDCDGLVDGADPDIADQTPPALQCPSNQTVSPDQFSPCAAAVNDIDAVFSDNCGTPTLSYSLLNATTGSGAGQASGLSYYPGTTIVVYVATDGVGLTSICTFLVTVNICGVVIDGTIRWEQNPASGVNTTTVTLGGDQTGSVVTTPGGAYTLTATSGSNFTVTPAKNLNKLNGVTVADVAAIQQHVANVAPLPAPFKRIAADVNKSNSITSLDATVLNQALLGNPSALNQMSSWRFVPASYSFPNPNVPWGFPEKITLTGVNGNIGGQDFSGIKLGDVVSTWANPVNFGVAEPLVLRVQDRVLEAGSEVVAEFRADQLDGLLAFQFALRFDPAQLLVAPISEGQQLVGYEQNYSLASGEIRVAWAQAKPIAILESTPVFRLRLTVLQGGARLSDVLRLDDPGDSGLPALAYTGAYEESGVKLQYSESTGTEPDAAIPELWLENAPNPFTNVTTLYFALPQAGEAELRVRDGAGRLLFTRKKHYVAGNHAEILRLDGTAGILHTELVSGQGAVLRKMLAAQ